MTEELQQNDNKGFKLEELTSDQHEVSLVPKTTTDFPFFYLTKHKERLAKPINYEGVDAEGRPIRWVATPNSTIGSPGIDAHEAWTRLIKPTWEAYRTSDDRLPNILPLGGVRQCLRVVGWGQGGWEARRLLKALNQIGATWCNADFWIPTSKKDEEGRPTFRAIKGMFSRLTIYAIGNKHLTEDELKDGKFSFDFDLEDTLYIQFHPLEVSIQESQPQRYLDNQYMFSVGPAARRWYELVAAKIFGVVKNNGDHCDVLYSWYVKHHHTLNRQTSRRRVVQQMNEIIHEHIESKFIGHVEYRAVKEPGKEIDFVIQIFPGPAAKESIARVISAINKKRMPPAGEPPSNSRRRQRKTIPQAVAGVQRPTTPELPAAQQGKEEVDQKLLAELIACGIFPSGAVKLLTSASQQQLERIGDYIDYWRQITGKKEPGLLYTLIKNGDPLPPNFETRRKRAERLVAEERRRNMQLVTDMLENAYDDYRKEAIDRYITEVLPAGEYERRVALRKQEDAKQRNLSDSWMNPNMIERMAQHTVRAEIAKGVGILPFDDFRRQELPRILAELKLDPAELGLSPNATPNRTIEQAPPAASSATADQPLS